jgi:DNA-binding PadR family transcriptional regulator
VVDAGSGAGASSEWSIQRTEPREAAQVAIESALLGLIAMEPRHGYDLAREFAPDTVLGDIVHLELGMLYSHLKRLELDGYISATIETQAARPPRKVFQLTPTGQLALERWLREPVTHTRELRLEFLLKLYVARQHDPQAAHELIVGQYALCKGFVTSFVEQLAAETDEFRRLVLEMRLAQNQALLDWLERARRSVVV